MVLIILMRVHTGGTMILFVVVFSLSFDGVVAKEKKNGRLKRAKKRGGGEGRRVGGLEYTCGVDLAHVHVHPLLQAIVVLFEIVWIFFFQFPPHYFCYARINTELIINSCA